MQESTTAVAANISHKDHATLPRVKKEKIGIEINDTSTMQQKIDQAINQLTSKYCSPPPTPKYRYSTSPSKKYKHHAIQYLAAQEIFRISVNHIYDDKGKRETVDTLLNGKNKIIWTQALSNEIGRLSQGNDAGVDYTDCFEFIHKHEVPAGRKVTYANFVCDHRPLKP